MSLTLGSGPLTVAAAGLYARGTSIDHECSYLEILDRRVRGTFGGETVVDTRAPRLLHCQDSLPQWWLPVGDLRGGLLSPTDRTVEGPMGLERLWDLRLGERHVPAAARDVVMPSRTASDVMGLVAIDFHALDRWLEEDEEVVGHPRDPYHRVDTRRSNDHVVVRVGGRVVAESDRATKVFETSLPTRYYLPAADVVAERLRTSLTRTICPYKGIASYWSVTVGSTVAIDAAWSYPDPLGEALGIAGMVSFLGDDVSQDVTRH